MSSGGGLPSVGGLAPQTREAIAGINPEAAGFCRPECCTGIPDKLAGSFGTLRKHYMLGTSMPPVSWNKTASNVQGYSALSDRVAGEDRAATKATVFFDTRGSPSGPAASSLLTFEGTATGVKIVQEQYPNGADAAAAPAVAATADLRDERFIFVCAHRTRDDRCGYCGPILVELLQKALVNDYPAVPVHVFGCSHVGGHTYAGNVLVYSAHAGHCFGMINPDDIEPLARYIASHEDSTVPDDLRVKLRGSMLLTDPALK